MKTVLPFIMMCFFSISVSAKENFVLAACPDSFVLDKDGSCHSCEELKRFQPHKTADCSNLCKTKDGQYLRMHQIFGCQLVNCPNGYKKTKFGDCIWDNKDAGPEKTQKDDFYNFNIMPDICPIDYPLRGNDKCYNCSYEKAIDLSPQDVHLCDTLCKDEKGNSTRKIYQKAGCGLIECPNDKPLRSNESCFACDDTKAYPSKNCDVCPERENIETNDGVVCALKTCPADKPLRDVFGHCYSCDKTGGVYVKPGECSNVCPKRFEQSPEEYPGFFYYDKSAKICSLSYQMDQFMNDGFELAIGDGIVVLPQNFSKSNCPEDKPLMDAEGGCYACDDPSTVCLEIEELCSKCPNRTLGDIRTTITDEGKRFSRECVIAK